MSRKTLIAKKEIEKRMEEMKNENKKHKKLQ